MSHELADDARCVGNDAPNQPNLLMSRGSKFTCWKIVAKAERDRRCRARRGAIAHGVPRAAAAVTRRTFGSGRDGGRCDNKPVTSHTSVVV
jgi:hypothetical protein